MKLKLTVFDGGRYLFFRQRFDMERRLLEPGLRSLMSAFLDKIPLGASFFYFQAL